MRIRFQNELPEASTVHWHGLIISYEMDGHPHHTTDAMMGQQGDRILVNGQFDAPMAVEARAHRLRMVNGSNSCI